MKTYKSIFLIAIFALLNLININAQTNVSKNVYIKNDSVFIESLNRYRKIRLYLPPDYHSSDKQYPVLYMHDGQNLFDPATSFLGEWGVDEVLDSLYESEEFSVIVIGIDNGGMKRMNEYNPWENKRFGKPEGKEYTMFIVNDLKPMIDKEYRTLSDSKHTGIAGSSMGGVISHYALFNYPDIFGKAGILSPSYWLSKEIYDFTKSSDFNKDQKIYMAAGEKEGIGITKGVKKMEKILKNIGFDQYNFEVKIVPEQKHNEAFWHTELPELLLFLFKY